MAVMISTNTFVNASFFDESRNFCAYYNCRRFVRVNPKKSKKTKVIFCLNLNTKEVGLQNSGNGGFGFKPSFDQYLQVMESVKAARKKKKSDRLLRDKAEDDANGGGGGGNGDSELRNRVCDSDKRIDRVFKRNEENGIQRVAKDVRLSKSSEHLSEDERFKRASYSREEMVIDRRIDRGFKRNEENGIHRVAKDVRLSKSGDSSMTVSDDERFKRTSYSREEMVSDRRIDRGFKRNEESGIKRVAKDVRLNKSGESLSEDERFKRTYLREEIVIDKRIDRGFKRSEESGIQREAKDVRLNKSGESLSDDERFKRTYSREEMVSDRRIEKGFKRSEESGIKRVTKDVRLSKSVESSVNVSEDERLKRTSYSREETVSDKRIDRGFKRSEESGIQRVIKDARLSKSVESLVTVSEDERFKRTSYSKQETGRYQRSSDTSRGIERGYKGDGFVVEGRRNERISRDEKWSKRGETSVTVSEDESFGRRYPKQEMGRYQRSSDASKGFERGSKGDGLDLVAEEKRIQRIANEMGAFRSGKLTVTKRIGSKRDDHDDDDSLFDMETPAFRFSDESSDIVDKPATSRVEMEDRIEKLAKVLNGADINMPEWVFSKAIRSARIRYNDYTIMRLIQFLGKLGNWRRVIQVIEWLQKQDRYKSNKLRIIYTNALNVLGKSRRPVEALNVFHAMLLQISSYPDMVAYRSVAVTLGQAGHIKELFHVIDTMRSPPKKKFKPTTLVKWDPRLEPDVVVYNAVLNACVQRKQWEGAFWVLQQFKQRGQKPSPITYGLVMEVMLACEKYNLVHEFFRKMQKSSIPNALAYRVLINTLWKEGKTDEAIQTVDDMESRGIVGSAALYYDLGRCLCSAGRCNEGLDMIKKICRVANKPLVVTYTGLIQACIDSGNIKDAAYIFDHMKEICSPNLITCNIMLKAYLESGLFEEARELFQKMSEDADHIKSSSDHETRVLPDTHTFNTMLDVCAKQRKWDDFGYAYREMLRHGYHVNAKRHLKMVLEASRAGKEEVMEATWEHLRRSNRIPPSPLIKERFCRKLEKGDYVLAISSLADLDGKIEETELRAFSTASWSKVLHRFEKDSVLRLMDDVNRRVGSINESSDSVLGNLLSSCKEFMKNRTQVLL